MKKILFSLLFIVPLIATAQYDSTYPRQVQRSYGFDWRNAKFINSLIIPNDTPHMAVADSGAVAWLSGRLYYWGGYAWSAMEGAASANYWSLSSQGMHNNQSGAVGIGTSSPDSLFKLDVKGDARIGWDSSHTTYFGNGLRMDFSAGVPRIYSPSKAMRILSAAASGGRLLLGTPGGNLGDSTSEVIVSLGDISNTGGIKDGILITSRSLYSSGNAIQNSIRVKTTLQQAGSPTGEVNGIYVERDSLVQTGVYNAIKTNGGNIVFQGLPVSSDTNTLKPGVYDAGGKLHRLTFWPSSSGSGISLSQMNDSLANYLKRSAVGDSIRAIAVTSFAGRSGPSITPDGSDYASYYPSLSSSYSNPSWIFDLPWTKITGTSGVMLKSDSSIYQSKYRSDTARNNIYAAILGRLSAVGGTLTGTGGSGFIGLPAQSSAPSTPASGFSLYANGSNALSWKGANGYVRTFDGTSNTADRTYTLPNSSGTFILSGDTSVFARKSMPAYSFRVNNTNATADATNENYRRAAEATYSGTPTFTGTAPSGSTAHVYKWQRVGDLVTLTIYLNYGSAGSSVSAITVPLPSDVPAPYEPTSTGAASTIIGVAGGVVCMTNQTTNSARNTLALNVNSGDTGWDLTGSFTAGAYRYFVLTATYLAQ